MLQLTEWADRIRQIVLANVGGPDAYEQAGLIGGAVLVAWGLAAFLGIRFKNAGANLQPGAFDEIRALLHGLRKQLLPLCIVAMLGLAIALSKAAIGHAWLVRSAQGVAIIFLIFSFLGRLTRNSAMTSLLRWTGVTIAVLYIGGWLDGVIDYLQSLSIQLGNFRISLYGILRTGLFGAILFWLGRASSVTGQRVIRSRTSFDAGSRELMAKLFEVCVYSIAVILLLNVMGIDLTALAVFGGALGIGLGLGLQAIASNFISGIIILLDRGITIGDYIQLEDGRGGTLREMSLRSARLETWDGKDIMVPNDRFITTAFTNWTRRHPRQRYQVKFQVAYATDIEAMIDIVRDVVRSHPQVLDGDDIPDAERADVEIEKFASDGLDILVEFWMEGIDEGDNHVVADLMLMIWTALKANKIEIPFPQREVRVLGAGKI